MNPETQPPGRPWQHWWILTAPLVWGGLMEYTMSVPRLGIILTLLGTLIIPIASWFLLRHHTPRWALPLAVFVILFAGIAALTVVNIRSWQHVVTGLSMLALFALLRGDDLAAGQPQRGRITSFAMGLAVFFLWLAAISFGVGLYVVVPWWWLVIIAGLTTMAIAFVTWASIDVPVSRFAKALPWSAIIGAELMLAVWWLPTPAHVGAIVAATAIMLWLQAGRHFWLQDWQVGRGRRYMIIGTSVISVVLLTARWT